MVWRRRSRRSPRERRLGCAARLVPRCCAGKYVASQRETRPGLVRRDAFRARRRRQGRGPGNARPHRRLRSPPTFREDEGNPPGRSRGRDSCSIERSFAMESRTQEPTPLAATGVVGLDDVLRGGLPRNRLYLIEGDPGAGKTTLALQFLMEGARRGEAALYVTLSETKEELLAVAASHGFNLDGIQICELGQTTRSVLAEVERTHPRRLAFDSLSEMRLLAQSPLRYRRQILSLKQFFVGRECTVLFLDDRTANAADLQVQSIAH